MEIEVHADVTKTTKTSPTAPKISGPTTLQITAGYSAQYTGVYTINDGGDSGATVTATGNAKVTWQASTKKLYIATGLTAGTYTITLKITNCVGSATCKLTITVKAAVPAPTITDSYGWSISASTSSTQSRIFKAVNGTFTKFQWAGASIPGVIINGFSAGNATQVQCYTVHAMLPFSASSSFLIEVTGDGGVRSYNVIVQVS